MNAEALIGMTLGNCTLQRLIGQGGMGAVFLAQQSRPRRQVAVKVLFPMTPLTPNQLAAFLERFRRETDAAASLEHPNIMPVYEYGEQNGLAYLVMPYIGAGTLRDEMERDGQMALPKVLNYLEQLAAALDFAHEHGVIHRDVKPANILETPEGRLLLTDFGLVKILAEAQLGQTRLTGPGAPVGTPDYMSPEQVLGDAVDGRADLYSLGVILYQMVTGLTPFRGNAPMQIAAQHLQTPPPPPRMLRPDLPLSAEQVLLRALAKKPDDRYATAQEMAFSMRIALSASGIPLDTAPSAAVPPLSQTAGRLFAAQPNAGGLADQAWRQGISAPMPAAHVGMPDLPPATGSFPAMGSTGRAGGSGLLSRTGMFPKVGTGALPAAPAGGQGLLSSATGAQRIPTGMLQTGTGAQRVPTGTLPTAVGTGSLPMPAPFSALSPDAQTALPGFPNTTGALALTNPHQTQGLTNPALKLTGPVKVVQLPIPGQPGRYVTGLLPVTTSPTTNPPVATKKRPWPILLTVLALMLIIVVSSGIFAWTRLHSGTAALTSQVKSQPNPQATATAQVQATVAANVLISDPLTQNIHNWSTTPADTYAFKNDGYHITNHDKKGVAVILPGDQQLTGRIVYSMTMQEIKGDDGNVNNSFGLILRFSQQNKGGQVYHQFYSFEVQNIKGGEYRFYKYDDSKGPANAWGKPLWNKNFGNEFHQGQGAKAVNTVKIIAEGQNFTFIVNGQTVGKIQNNAINGGTVGMLVNLNGTEIAFRDMLITRN